MNILRVTALVAALVTLTCWSGAAAQETSFTCADFITQTAARTNLERPAIGSGPSRTQLLAQAKPGRGLGDLIHLTPGESLVVQPIAGRS